MDAVKAECKRIGLQFKMVLTITLDNYSYYNFGSNIEYTITGGSTPVILYANNQVSSTTLIHEFQGVGGLSAGVTYSITANIPGVGGNTLTFTPNMGLCGGVGQVVIVDSNLVIVKPNSHCPDLVNLVPNGNFMYGNNGTFQSDLPPGCNACVAGGYCVGNQFRVKCSSWPAGSWDHTLGTSSGSYLLIDGNANQPCNIWRTQVQVCGGRTYTFSFWAKSIYPDPFQLGFMINNLTVPTATSPSITGQSIWRQYSTTWTCSLSAGTTATIPIGIRQMTAGHRRDFGIDDVFFGYCCNCAKP